jgi:hypothetical protein
MATSNTSKKHTRYFVAVIKQFINSTYDEYAEDEEETDDVDSDTQVSNLAALQELNAVELFSVGKQLLFLETDELEEGDLTSEEAEEMFINWLENCADGWDYLSMKPITVDGKKMYQVDGSPFVFKFVNIKEITKEIFNISKYFQL